jgi:hypothetical protein
LIREKKRQARLEYHSQPNKWLGGIGMYMHGA